MTETYIIKDVNDYLCKRFWKYKDGDILCLPEPYYSAMMKEYDRLFEVHTKHSTETLEEWKKHYKATCGVDFQVRKTTGKLRMIKQSNTFKKEKING